MEKIEAIAAKIVTRSDVLMPSSESAGVARKSMLAISCFVGEMVFLGIDMSGLLGKGDPRTMCSRVSLVKTPPARFMIAISLHKRRTHSEYDI